MMKFTFPSLSLYGISMAFIFCLVLRSGALIAQVDVTIRDDPQGVAKDLGFSQEFADSLEARNYIFNTVSQLRSNGFLLANVDSLYGAYPKLRVVLHVGRKYELTSLKFSNIPEGIQNRLKNKPKKYLKETYRTEEVEELLKEIISYSENNGYPFASVKLDSVRVIGTSLNAQLIYHPGPLITFDSVHLSTSVNVKSKFITAYLGIVPGKTFDQRIIDQIPARLEQLNYVESLQPPNITFSNEECQVHLNLKNIKSNKLDGYLGLFPNAADGNNLLITGKLDLQLRNLFRSGKSLTLFWEKQQVATQLLVVNYLHPNLFGSPVGLLAGIDLYKQDTTFINRHLSLGISYLTKTAGTVSAFSSWETSRTIGDIPNQTEIVDFNLNNFGLRIENLSPQGFTSLVRSSWGLNIGGTIGRKSIINLQDSDTLGITLDPESIQYALDARIAGQFQIKRSLFLFGRVYAGKMVNDQLFLNDLYRIGGLNTIRGFYENEFYASEFITATIEARYYFAERSNLVAFFDLGSISYQLVQDEFNDQPFGFGIGTNIETNAGILSLNYAVGKSSQQPLDLKFSKIHIGYIASF